MTTKSRCKEATIRLDSSFFFEVEKWSSSYGNIRKE
jgi:hypothetical protein